MLVAASSAVRGEEDPCARIVGLLATEFVYKVPNSELARVEIRQCAPEDSSTIQLTAWPSGRTISPLIIRTDHFGVVQAIWRANVFVVETGGATRNQVLVISYARGEPKLVLKRLTQGTARVNIRSEEIEVVIDGIYAGDSPPRTESYRFKLDPEGMKAK